MVKWPTQTTTRPLFANRGPVPTVAHLIVFNKQPRADTLYPHETLPFLGLLERRATVVSKSDHVLRGHHRRPST
ncbi:MAG: hypothetical protein WA760_01020, partial [Pseudolabrys sp.]